MLRLNLSPCLFRCCRLGKYIACPCFWSVDLIQDKGGCLFRFSLVLCSNNHILSLRFLIFPLEGFLCLFCGEKIEKGNISAIMGRYKKSIMKLVYSVYREYFPTINNGSWVLLINKFEFCYTKYSDCCTCIVIRSRKVNF